MDEQRSEEMEDPVAEAFDRLRGEVAATRLVMQSFAAERAEDTMPDYSATLGEIVRQVERHAQAIEMLGERPALGLTPEAIARQIAAAGTEVRHEDAAALDKARSAMERMATELARAMVSARTAADQRRWVIRSAVGGMVVGALLWAVVPGLILRALSESWVAMLSG